MSDVKEADRLAIRQALNNRDQAGLDEHITMMVLDPDGPGVEKIEALLNAESDSLDPDTLAWWDKPCNCDGHLN